MAKAANLACVGVALGVWLAGSGGLAISPPVFAGPQPGAGQAMTVMRSAYAAFNAGRDHYRRADYEQAAVDFAQAQANQNDLPEAERQELGHWIELNTQALQAQREGDAQLRQAEMALQAGQVQTAERLFRTLSVNQFLAPADKAKVLAFAEQARQGDAALRQAIQPATESPAAVAHDRLHQARTLMAQGEYDAAMALAEEAARLKVTYRSGDDTPRRVMDDIAHARKDARGLLASSRAALRRGDYELATRLANQAQKAGSSWTFRFRGDSPARVLKEIEAARGMVAVMTPQAPGAVSAPAASGGTVRSHSLKTPSDAQAAAAGVPGNEVVQARTPNTPAVGAGEIGWMAFSDAPSAATTTTAAASADDVRRLYEQAQRALQECQLQLNQTEPARASAPVPSAPQAGKNGPPGADDPQSLLQKARQLFEFGRYRAAETVARYVKAIRPAGWPRQDDTPDDILADVGRARLQAGLATAPATYRARGSAPESDHAAVGPDSTPGGAAASAMDSQLQNAPAKQRARQLMAEAQRLQSQGRLVEARRRAMEARVTCGAFGPDEENPDQMLAQLASIATRHIEEYVKQATRCVSSGRADSPSCARAEESLLRARQLSVDFGLDRQPIEAMLIWVRQARLKAEGKMMPTAAPATGVASLPSAPAANSSAQPMQPMGRPAQAAPASPYAGATARVRPMPSLPSPSAAPVSTYTGVPMPPAPASWPSAAVPTPTQPSAKAPNTQMAAAPKTIVPVQYQPEALKPKAPTPAVRPAPRSHGEQLLIDARLELKRGEVDNARRLAEEAYSNLAYGVRDQAEAVLRTIAAQDYNRRAIVAGRSYEAGMSLVRRKEYAQAAVVFRGIDPMLLAPERQARLRELMQMPEMQPRSAAASPLTLAAGVGGRATATDATPLPDKSGSEKNYTQQVQAMQDVKFQKLRLEGMNALREATKCSQAREYDQALDVLQGYLDRLREESIEPDRLALLRDPVEKRVSQVKAVKAQQDVQKMRVAQQTAFQDSHLKQVKAEELKRQQVGDLLKQSNQLYAQCKYAEAEVAAQKAHELDPGNAAAAAQVKISHMAGAVHDYKNIKKDKEDFVLKSLDDTDKEGPAVDIREPEKFDKDRWAVAKNRKGSQDLELLRRKTDKEREIERRLHTPTSLDFKDAPLKQVLEDLSATNQINIVPDQAALDDAGISLDRPMTMKLEGVELKSALNLMLGQAHLTYVIKDEVLCVTTESHARGKLVQRVYQVADIIIPVENYTGIPNPLEKAEDQAWGRTNRDTSASLSTNSWPTGLGGTGVGSPSSSGSPGANSPGDSPGLQQAARAAGLSSGMTPKTSNGRAPENTMQDLLMDLIQNTIQPTTWSKAGGPGTIDYYPLGMALVITQTPDIQEQIQDLLQALRRLQDLEVAVEIRFITLDEAFYERIGVNFNLNIVNRHQTKFEPQLVNAAFAPAGFLNAFRPDGFFTGLQAPNVFTSDLGVPIAPSSFSPAIPPFGGYPNTINADGGLSLGMAFLSDIQVFMFLEAAQADRRTNVMQAPKLTMFNGQTSTLTVGDSQFFVTNVTVTGFGGQLVFQPVNTIVTTGVTLTLQPVVSADRRFVRISLAPTLNNVTSPTTALFPVTAFITPVLAGGVPGPPVPFTQYVQTPVVTTVGVLTTVSVPDGGTVLLGGLKTLREGRNEFGPPILSKLPYINRLFKNVGYGREAESLLMMVTPRVIINEEEEVIQTGEAGGGPR